jgi:AraC-like DNA-binding protein
MQMVTRSKRKASSIALKASEISDFATPQPELSGDTSILNVIVLVLEAERRGLRVEELLASCSIRDSTLRNPMKRIRRHENGRIFEEFARVSGDRYFHVAAMMNAPLGRLGPLDYIMTMSPTLRDGARRCGPAIPLADNGVRITFEDEPPVMVMRSIFEPSPHRMEIECIVAAAVSRIKLASGQGIEHVTFNIQAQDSQSQIEALLGCSVSYNVHAPYTRMQMLSQTIDKPTRNSHPAIAQLISVPLIASQTLGDRVLDVLVSGIPMRAAAMRWVSESLGMTEKTLRNKLRLERLNFRSLVVQAKERIRRELLAQGSLRLKEVSKLLKSTER